MNIPNRLRQEGIRFVLLEKGGKKPFEQEWQKKDIKWDDAKLNDHVNSKGNYGVVGGGENNLIIIDFDNEKVQEEVLKQLPKTFTVKAGGGLLHKYFMSDKSESFKIFDEEMKTLADVQGEGKQVVGAGSIHPNGNTYEIVDNNDIVFLPYAEIKATMMAYDRKPKKEIKKKDVYVKGIGLVEQKDNDFIEKLKSQVNFESLLNEFGVDTSKNPTNCPFHSSKGGKCLGWNDETAHCFHCDESWNCYSLVMQHKNYEFKESLEWMAKREGMIEELKQSREKFKENAAKVFTPKGQAKVFTNLQPLFYDRNGLWWLWNLKDYCWGIVDEVDVLNMIDEDTGEDVISPRNRTLILNSLKQQGRKNIPEEIKPTWVQFKETIVDVETGEEFKASPQYFVTNPIQWDMEKKIFDTENMDRIFEEWVGKEYVELLYEIIAYSILPDYPIHRIFCFIGSGLNGKSKFLELLRKFVGKENVCSTELDTLLGSRFEVTRLHKKLVCQMGETNFNEMSKTSMLKKLCGGDLIGFEYKNKNPFEEKNYAKIIIATNNLPTTTDKTIGFYRRWTIIDFPNQFNEKKNILDEIPEKEFNSLASRCVVTLKDILKKRCFTNEGTIEERTEKYESKSNFLEQFLKLFTIGNINGYITKADFYKKFVAWSKENNHREMSENSVGMAMKKLGVETEKKYFDWLFDGKGGQLRCWVSVKWLE